MINRSTMQYSVQSLPDLVKYSFLLNPKMYAYNVINHQFAYLRGALNARDSTYDFQLRRSLGIDEFSWINTGIQDQLKKLGFDYRLEMDESILKEDKSI